MPNDLPAFQTNPSRNGSEAAPRALWRFRVESLIPDDSYGGSLVKARTYDGTDKGPVDYIIRVSSAFAEGDSFYATKPEGGTGANYGNPRKPVVWMESPVGIAVAYGKATTDWKPNIAGTMPAVFPVQPCDSGGNASTTAATIQLYTSALILGGHKNLYLPIRTNDVVAYLPIMAGYGIVLQIPDDGGDLYAIRQQTGPQVVGYDRLRSHPYNPTPAPPNP